MTTRFTTYTCKDCIFFGDHSCHRESPKVIVVPFSNPLEPRSQGIQIQGVFPPVDSERTWCGNLVRDYSGGN